MEALQKFAYSISFGIRLNTLTICNRPFIIITHTCISTLVYSQVTMHSKGANALNGVPNHPLPVAMGDHVVYCHNDFSIAIACHG